MSSNLFDINQNKAHKVSKVICLKCYHRFISTRPLSVLLEELECPKCKEVGYIIETGEWLEDE